MTQGLRLDRFAQLADFLETLDPEKFDFRLWVSMRWKGAQDLSCGAPACGLGWATVLFGKECAVEFSRIDSFSPPCIRIVDVEGSEPLDAARCIFGDALTEEDFDRLFVPNVSGEPIDRYGRLAEDSTAKELAAHIRKFIREQARELES
jgi:hypothetical protein